MLYFLQIEADVIIAPSVASEVTETNFPTLLCDNFYGPSKYNLISLCDIFWGMSFQISIKSIKRECHPKNAKNLKHRYGKSHLNYK